MKRGRKKEGSREGPKKEGREGKKTGNNRVKSVLF